MVQLRPSCASHSNHSVRSLSPHEIRSRMARLTRLPNSSAQANNNAPLSSTFQVHLSATFRLAGVHFPLATRQNSPGYFCCGRMAGIDLDSAGSIRPILPTAGTTMAADGISPSHTALFAGLLNLAARRNSPG